MFSTNEQESTPLFCEIRFPTGVTISLPTRASLPSVLEDISKYGWLNQAQQIPQPADAHITPQVIAQTATSVVEPGDAHQALPVASLDTPLHPQATRDAHPAPIEIEPSCQESIEPASSLASSPLLDAALEKMGSNLVAFMQHENSKILTVIKGQVIEQDCLFSAAMEEFYLSTDYQSLDLSRKGVYQFLHQAFVDIVGDKLLSEIRYKDISTYTSALKHIPANAKQKPDFKDKDYRTIARDAKSGNLKPIATSTQYKHVKAARAFFRWCMERFEMKRDVTCCVKGSDYAREDAQSREPFSIEELKKISSEELIKAFDKPWKFFAIPIGYYTGARINEIAQLHVSDIYEVPIGVHDDGTPITTPCISLNSFNKKNLKSRNAKRLVPIHKELIDVGFLEYVKYMKTLGFIHLFPDLHGRESRPGTYISAWFNGTHLKSWCEIDDVRKKYHSFRNHFITFAELSINVPHSALKALAGLGRGREVEWVHYIKKADIVACKKAMDAIQLPAFKYPTFDAAQFEDYFATELKYPKPGAMVSTPTPKKRGRPKKKAA